MFRCIARPLRVLFLFALCLPAEAATPADTGDEPDPKRAKLEDIASADTMIMVPMRDGTGLATDVWLPKDRQGPLPVIFVKTPYDFNRIEGSQLDGYEREEFMRPGEIPGEIYELKPTPMSTSYVFREGHRIRVEVASAKFPQYMRNLNTGGNNYDETEAVVARNTVHHSPRHPSRIVLPVVPSE